MPEQMVWLVVAVVLVLAAAGALAIARGRKRLGGAGEQPQIAPPAGPTNRFTAALQRTRDALGDSFRAVFGRERADEAAYEGLEEILLRADVGARATGVLLTDLRARVPTDAPASALRDALRTIVRERLSRLPTELATVEKGPLVILVVGVNGSGKTTTIGKLAARYRREGRTVMLGAGDTFRAGAIEQLKVWGERADVPVVAHQEGADPAAVLHDTLQSATAKGIDVVICDTAGRLQAQKTLMDELAKVVRVMKKAIPEAPHEVLLVLDATIGQNAISQARIFKEVVGVTGVVLTKLDGTARGGVVVAVNQETGLPVKLVGLGEGIDDLRDFEPEAFVDGLLGEAPGR